MRDQDCDERWQEIGRTRNDLDRIVLMKPEDWDQLPVTVAFISEEGGASDVKGNDCEKEAGED